MFRKYSFKDFIKFLLIKIGVAKLLKLKLNIDEKRKTFALYSELVDRIYGCDDKIIFEKIPSELVSKIKKEFCNDSSFAESSNIILNSPSTNPILSITNHKQIFKEKMNKKIIAGNIHKFSYSTNQCLKELHDVLRKIFSNHIKSPFIFINTRLWKTKPGLSNLGMNEWHNDGFFPGFTKIMVYLTPCNKDYGSFKYICPKSHLVKEIKNEEGGQVVYFSNSDIEHAGTAGIHYHRICIELTIFKTVQNVGIQQECKGHFWGRELKNIKEFNSLNNIKKFF